MKFKSLIFSVVLLFSSVSYGAHETVQELKMQCEDNPKGMAMYCMGYLTAFLDHPGNLMLSAYPYCTPKGFTLGQFQDIFLKWAKENPQHYHILAPFGIMRALHKTFPCEEKTKK